MQAETESCSKPLVCEMTRTCFRWVGLACGAGGNMSWPVACAGEEAGRKANRSATRMGAGKNDRKRRNVSPLFYGEQSRGRGCGGANRLRRRIGSGRHDVFRGFIGVRLIEERNVAFRFAENGAAASGKQFGCT